MSRAKRVSEEREIPDRARSRSPTHHLHNPPSMASRDDRCWREIAVAESGRRALGSGRSLTRPVWNDGWRSAEVFPELAIDGDVLDDALAHANADAESL